MDKKIMEIDSKLDKHISVEGVKMDAILKKVDKIENNHLNHIQSSMATITQEMTKSATNIDWLMRSYWIVVTASVGAFVAGIVKLFF